MYVTALLRQNECETSLSVRPGSAPAALDADVSEQKQGAMGLDDAELARRVAQNDRLAAAALVTRYQSSLRAFLGRLTGRQELADDLAQETFVRMLRYAHRYDPRYPMKTWLYTIARRLLINHLRDHGRMMHVNQFDGEHSQEAGPAEQAAHADDRRHARSMLKEAIAKLTEPQREVLLLFYHQDQSIEQIADTMQMPHGTVKSHLHRARTTLRKLLAPQWEALQP